MRGVCSEIKERRDAGVVHCGACEVANSVEQLAARFGLKPDRTCYLEIDESQAREIALRVLHRDLAYGWETMPQAFAKDLVSRFFALFLGDTCRFFTNGTFHEPSRSAGRVTVGPSWDPVTDATFDTRVLVLGNTRAGCLWVEDED